MKRARQIYWLVNELTPCHRGRAMILTPHGFEVKFFTSLASIKKAIQNKRAGIIFLADDATEYDNDIHIRALAEMPELKGARLVLTIHNGFENNLSVAAGLNYRDFISVNLSDDLWAKRVNFSCAGTAQPYVQPAGQISMNNISAISLPSRLIWISDSRLRLECRVKPPVGSKFKLTGKLAANLGVKYISLTVESCENSHLHHRFSDAIIARWKIPEESKPNFQDLIWRLRMDDSGPSYRAFVAAKSAPLRNQLLEKLGRDDFTVSSALQIQSMVTEPKFFTPDIVFIEDALTSNTHASRFTSMLENLSAKVAVIIIGANVNRDALRKKHKKTRLLFLKEMPEDFEKSVLNKVLPSVSRGTPNMDLGATHFPQSDDLSYGDLLTPARLTQIHPKVMHFTSPFDIGRFGVAKISSPVMKKILGRDPWIKITETHRNHRADSAPFIFSSEAFLMDTTTDDQRRMSIALSELVQTHFAKFLDLDESQPAIFDRAERTPEFGSLKKVPSPPGVRTENIGTRTTGTVNTPVNTPGRIVASQQQQIKHAGAAAYGLTLPDDQIQEIDLSAEDIKPIDSIAVTHQAEFEEVDISIKDATEEFGGKAMDVAQNVYDNVTSRSFKRVVIMVAFSAFGLAFIIGIFYSLAANYNRSGKVFSESLYNYAPHLQKGQKKPNSSLPVPFRRKGNKPSSSN